MDTRFRRDGLSEFLDSLLGAEWSDKVVLNLRPFLSRGHMDSSSVHVERRFHHGFRKRRMRMDGLGDIRGCSFQAHGHDGFTDQVRRMGAKDMYAEDLVI